MYKHEFLFFEAQGYLMLLKTSGLSVLAFAKTATKLISTVGT